MNLALRQIKFGIVKIMAVFCTSLLSVDAKQRFLVLDVTT
jgi:hypothetical protein